MVRRTQPTDVMELVLRHTYDAPLARVYSAWIDPDQLKSWLRPTNEIEAVLAEVDLRIGGVYRLGYQVPGVAGELVVAGTYQEIVPNKKLVFTWEWESHPNFQGEETLVTVEFDEVDGQTEVTLTHQRFPTEVMRADHEWGWTGATEQLVRHCRFVCRSIPDGQRPF
ncbi:MAG: SRPBCC family protein [Aeoliella sp.]